MKQEPSKLITMSKYLCAAILNAIFSNCRKSALTNIVSRISTKSDKSLTSDLITSYIVLNKLSLMS